MEDNTHILKFSFPPTDEFFSSFLSSYLFLSSTYPLKKHFEDISCFKGRDVHIQYSWFQITGFDSH